MIQLFSLIAAPVWWVGSLLAIAYGIGVSLTYKMLSPYLPKRLVAGCLFYMILLSLLSMSAVTGSFSTFNPGSVLVAIGTLLFMASDTKLSFEIFKGASKNGNLIVMSAYIAAQLLIVSGFFLWMV